MKGIILAGGAGTRLAPLTQAVSKQLLPVYDKPMVYYPLSTLILAGIRQILLIATPHDLPGFQRLLGDGAQLGLELQYCEQAHPNGLAEAFLLGENFIGDESVALILGDNLFYGQGFGLTLERHRDISGALIFGYQVNDPSESAVVEFDPADTSKILSLEEKPQHPKSNFAVPGLYFYDNRVSQLAKSLRPSARGELEITDLNRAYWELGALRLELLARGVAWLDTGRFDDLADATTFIRTLQNRQNLLIGSPEEAAWRKRFITHEQLLALAQPLQNSQYGQRLLAL